MSTRTSNGLAAHDRSADWARKRRDRHRVAGAALGEVTGHAAQPVPAHFRATAVGVVDGHFGRETACFTDDEDAVRTAEFAARIAEGTREVVITLEARRTFVKKYERILRPVHLHDRHGLHGLHSGRVSGACGEIVETACL